MAVAPNPAGLGGFGEAYVERCRTARLRRWPGRLGSDALRLQRGDLYAWREGLPRAPGELRVSLLAEPRTVGIVADRIWWVPRLEQLLDRLEAAARLQDADLPRQRARERIALRLADRLHEWDESWEEVALDLLEQDAAPA